jgi:putative transposase
VEKNGEVKFSLCKDITPETKPVPQGGEIGLDFGMNTLFATSMGDQYGQKYYKWLIERDKELMELTKSLQRNHIKPSKSKRHEALQRRISEYSINEVNRVLNRIIAVYGPSAIIVEKLDFRGGGLSRKLNRLLQRIGLGQVYKKLDMLAQETGVKIVKVPAPYTSQGCSGCDYVDDRNRKGSRFSCRFCGKKNDAGVNASRKVKSRRSWQKTTLHASRVKVLALCDDTFKTRWGHDPVMLRSVGRRQSRATSRTSLTADGLDTQPENTIKGSCRNVNMVPVPF